MKRWAKWHSIQQWHIIGGIALILAIVLWIMPGSSKIAQYWLRYGVVFVFLWVLPGLAWSQLISRHVLDAPERWVLSMGLSFVVTPFITFLLVYLPGPISQSLLILVTLANILLPLGLSLVYKLPYRSPGLQKSWDWKQVLWRDGWGWLLIAIVIAAGLRVVNLGYSEFQGDEAKVMIHAARSLTGDEVAIFQHRKGPAELAVTMATWRLTGITNEWMARFPVTWAGILGLVAVFVLARRMGYPHAGGIAACLLAINGYFVAFGRIVQYQSIVFLLSTLGLLCLYVYATQAHRSLVIVAALLFGVGGLAHYDTFLALPAGLLLIGNRLWQDRHLGWRSLIPVGIAGVAGAVIVGSFFIPYVQNPYIGDTSSYLSRRLGDQLFYNNLWSSFELTTVYNAIYFLGAMVLLLMAQLLLTWSQWGQGILTLAERVLTWSQKQWRYVAIGLVVLLLAVITTTFIWPDAWILDTLAWLPFAILLVGAVLAPGQPLAVRMLWLWMSVPMLFYLFFVDKPRTHIHVAFPAWSLLGGWVIIQLKRWLDARVEITGRVAASVVGVALYLVSAYYAVIVFVDHTPEYRRTFPQSKLALYWTPYEQIPSDGLFGFPYRAGWKAIGYLMENGELPGNYESNEEWKVTGYYTRWAGRFKCVPSDIYSTYIKAVNVQDESHHDWDYVYATYPLDGVVTVAGQSKMTLYRRNHQNSSVVTYAVEDYEREFDLTSTPEHVTAHSAFNQLSVVELTGFTPHEATLGDAVQLLGYRLNTQHAIPGGYVTLELMWRALKIMPTDYNVFTHLHDGEMMWGQLDRQPMVCDNVSPTSSWLPGYFVIDAYQIPISADAPSGLVPVTVGMYDWTTMQRLPVSVNGMAVGDSVYLTDVDIRSR
ncbi:MAG: glycosyltransferase family 39 protein [Anaerolineae bacterium]|nr:glycosyltransferase family 39 protein [Anaerolineae bacterium]